MSSAPPPPPPCFCSTAQDQSLFVSAAQDLATLESNATSPLSFMIRTFCQTALRCLKSGQRYGGRRCYRGGEQWLVAIGGGAAMAWL
ncbi:hypothetical protein RIF29_28524 [Crotalaria pallida]|uniref:Uncharacterized protein n=1 Tax=Crotalaria pallida TaxID=3830 RepID=A0AAN9EF73_CROPI